jgi:hypothetical protein
MGRKTTNTTRRKIPKKGTREWEFEGCVLSKAMDGMSEIWSKLHSKCGIMLYPELSKRQYKSYCQIPLDRIQKLSVYLVKRLKRMKVSPEEFQRFVDVRSCGGFVGRIVE